MLQHKKWKNSKTIPVSLEQIPKSFSYKPLTEPNRITRYLKGKVINWILYQESNLIKEVLDADNETLPGNLEIGLLPTYMLFEFRSYL